jgi:hypothetical protein
MTFLAQGKQCTPPLRQFSSLAKQRRTALFTLKFLTEMLALRETVKIPEDHMLHLKVPNVPKGEEVEVFVMSKDDRRTKLALMTQAATDPLYQNDIQDIAEDFSASDSEHH